MALQFGKQIITTNILPNISKSNNNQTMKFGFLEYNVKNVFLQRACRKGSRVISSRSLPFFKKKTLFEVKPSGPHVSFNIFW